MSTKLKEYLSITTCLFFLVIGCAINHQDSNRLGTNEEGKPYNSSTHDVGSDTFDDDNLKKTSNTENLEKDGLKQHNFGENGATDSSLSGSSDGVVIYPTAQKPSYNMYSQSAQDRDDDHDDDDHDDDDHDDDNHDDDDHDDDDHDDDDDDDDDHDDDDHDDNDDDHDDDDDDDELRKAANVGVVFDNPADAGRPSPSFNVDILPILTNRCAFAGCHVAGGPGGIDLRTYRALRAGGKDGAIIIAGDARDSELVEQIVEGKMPPNGPPLPAAQIQLIIDWINEGAKNNDDDHDDTHKVSLRGDVNDDGVVNTMDLLLVASQFGATGMTNADINGDGIVDAQDLVLVAIAFDGVLSAPAADGTLTMAQVRHWLELAKQELARPTQASVAAREFAYNRGVQVLKQMVRKLVPQTTALLPNYPNPFNPETWIPYHLATASHVQITIYDASGHLVRSLALGHQTEGYYTSKGQAAYWDGRDSQGQIVGSGPYFYQLQAGSEALARKMLILK